MHLNQSILKKLFVFLKNQEKSRITFSSNFDLAG